MLIGALRTKTGVSYGDLYISDIDLEVDRRTYLTIYSEIMHHVKRSGYVKAYRIWTEQYEEAIEAMQYGGKVHARRVGEAVRFYCAQQAGLEFESKFAMCGDEKWIINSVYFCNGELDLDPEFLNALQTVLVNLEDCFAIYKIAFTQVDEAL